MFQSTAPPVSGRPPAPLAAPAPSALSARPARLAACAVAVLAVAALPVASLPAAPAHAVTATAGGGCAVQALPLPAGVPAGTPTGTDGEDHTGRYVVGYYTSGSSRVPTVWDDGTPQALTDVPLTYPSLAAVNDSGMVAGDGIAPGGRPRAYVYSRGAYTVLPNPDTTAGASAIAINDRGDVLGTLVGPNGTPTRGIVWPAGHPDRYRLLTASGSVTARDLDDDGTVVGAVGDTGYRWSPDGTGHALPAGPDGKAVYAFAIRRGWVVGLDQNAAGSRFGVRWNLRGGPAMRLPGTATWGYDVNSAGIVGGETPQGATLVRGGKLVALPEPAGATSGRADRVADRDGRAAGDVVLNSAQPQAVRWSRC